MEYYAIFSSCANVVLSNLANWLNVRLNKTRIIIVLIGTIFFKMVTKKNKGIIN